jgi:hypothetical protein
MFTLFYFFIFYNYSAEPFVNPPLVIKLNFQTAIHLEAVCLNLHSVNSNAGIGGLQISIVTPNDRFEHGHKVGTYFGDASAVTFAR